MQMESNIKQLKYSKKQNQAKNCLQKQNVKCFIFHALSRPYESSKLWFLRDADDHEHAKDALDSLSSMQSTLKKDEQAIIKINNLVVKIEAGIGNNTIPLLLLESSLSCNVNDWSSRRMTLIGSVNVEMAYYNAKLALWEPVIEPIATFYSPDGSVVRKRLVFASIFLLFTILSTFLLFQANFCFFKNFSCFELLSNYLPFTNEKLQQATELIKKATLSKKLLFKVKMPLYVDGT